MMVNTTQKTIVNAILLCGLVMSILTGCSQRKNPVGNESNITPELVRLRDAVHFEYIFSYEDSVSNSMPNDKLIVGSYLDNTSIILLRFGNLPALAEITTDAVLTLGIKGNYNAEEIPLSLSLIEQQWEQLQTTYRKAAKDSLWQTDWSTLTPLDAQYTYSDSMLTFTLSKQLIEQLVTDWTSETPQSYGLALYSTQNASNSYLELSNKDAEEGPRLKFSYLAEGATEAAEYSRRAIHNAFINSGESFNRYDDILRIGNLPPTKTVLKLNIPEAIFGVAQNELHKVTINRAEIILFPDKDNSHFSPTKPFADGEAFTTIIPYHLKAPVPQDIATPLAKDAYLLIENTRTSTLSAIADSVAVNITPLLQAYVSGMKSNNGIVLVSGFNNKDNTKVLFHSLSDANTGKRPYLRIIYSKPRW